MVVGCNYAPSAGTGAAGDSAQTPDPAPVGAWLTGWPDLLDENEIEIASEQRSPEWLATTFSNQSEANNFFDVVQELDPN